MTVTGFTLDRQQGRESVVVEFDDGLHVVFCAHSVAVPRPKLSYVDLRSFWTGERLARFNVHESTGGGKFRLLDDSVDGAELGVRWEEAHHYLDIDRQSPTLRLGITDERRTAWDHVKGSLVYAQRLKTRTSDTK